MDGVNGDCDAINIPSNMLSLLKKMERTIFSKLCIYALSQEKECQNHVNDGCPFCWEGAQSTWFKICTHFPYHFFFLYFVFFLGFS